MENSQEHQLFLESHRALKDFIATAIQQRTPYYYVPSPNSMNYASLSGTLDPWSGQAITSKDVEVKKSTPFVGDETLQCMMVAFLDSHRKLR